jgi:hypothetical protein
MENLQNLSNIWRKLIKFFKYGSLTVVILLIVCILGLNIWGQISIYNAAKSAINVFHKDKVESLLMEIDSDNFSLKEKNHAIEVLGALEDKRALKKLESLVTHRKCNHATELCQYNLEKSIRKIKGEYYVLFGIFYIQKK